MRRSVILFAVVTLAACGGTKKLREAPRASSLEACFATRDASNAASAVVYANSGNHPKTFFAMTRSKPPVLDAGADATVTAHAITGKGWTLTMSGGGASAPKFTCARAAPG